MNNIAAFLKQILPIGICIVLLSCQHANQHTGYDRLPDPIIKAGIAKVTGKLSCFQLRNYGSATLTLYVPHPVTAEMGKFETKVNKDGSFHFEVPVECDKTIGAIRSDIFNVGIDICLVVNEETKMGIIYEAGNKKANMVSSLGLTSNDLLYLNEMVRNFIEEHDTLPLYKLTPEEFSHFVTEKLMTEKINKSINDSVLSEKAKSYVTNECKLICLNGILLWYRDYISLNYKNFKTKGEQDNFVPKEPDKSYYTFLKDFNLNDPEYLYNPTYTEVLRSILSNKTLNIPAINDMPVQEWLVEVKKIVADLIGSDKGLFYDILVANAYARQFNEELKPLTDKQKENIISYYKDDEIGKILLKRSEKIIKLVEERDYFNTFANATPIVPKEALMNAIISKYKGKAVLVDFWATWCGPCMNAIKEIRPIKSELHNKPITFVYFTNSSSPIELWKKNINMIGGEQYYLKDDEWEYVMSEFGFNYIPSYLFYDKNGVLKNKVTPYPGTDKMRKMIGALLP